MQVRDLLKTRASAKVRVIVELAVRSPEEKDVEHLVELGLEVERVIGNKVLGSIASTELPGLEKDESVRAVELSRKLSLH